MTEKRLQEATARVEELRTSEGKDFLRGVIKIAKDNKLVELIASTREFRWFFDKMVKMANTIPRETLMSWEKEIAAEVEEGK